MRIAYWTPKAATNTHFRNMQYLLLFLCNNGRTNAPQFYVISTLFFLLTTKIYNVGSEGNFILFILVFILD